MRLGNVMCLDASVILGWREGDIFIRRWRSNDMKVAVACDHRGYEAKRKLMPILRAMGHEVEDFGCESTASVDYPDYAIPAARAVGSGACDLGILLDGSGIGMSVAANKVIGVRAALVHDEVTAVRARELGGCMGKMQA